MCGISGIYSLSKLFSMRSAIEDMVSALSHRGPDKSGVFVEDKIALGHNRLAVIDLSRTGDQPMQRSPGGSVICYNGEVYNYQLLRSELKKDGYLFKGQSDTEVVLATYEKHGVKGLSRIEGMFALAIWDPDADSLILMRDRLGIKPLYYVLIPGGVAFASEYKALLKLNYSKKEIDQQSFCEYLWFGNTFAERTFFEDIKQILPGSMLRIKGGVIKQESWWKVEDWIEPEPTSIQLADLVDKVSSSLDYAVSRQMVADVPVSLFLSGGVDSSAIASSASGASNDTLMSHSIGFGDSKLKDELELASSVASRLGLLHHEHIVNKEQLLSNLKELAFFHDDPFADAANLPLFQMSKALRGHSKVVLQGDGGDEMFAGYRRYNMLAKRKLWQTLPSFPSFMVGRSSDLIKRYNRVIDAMSQDDDANTLALLLTLETLRAPPSRVLSIEKMSELSENTDPFLVYREANERFRTKSMAERMLLTDICTQLPSQFLTKVDRATMAASIESRVPLLDENVLRLALNIPLVAKLAKGKSKYLLRRAISGKVPYEVYNGPKRGFGVPYGSWLKDELFVPMMDIFTDYSFCSRFGLNSGYLERIAREHQEGLIDSGFLLYKLFSLGLWHEANSYR